MGTINGQAISRGDRVKQVADIGLAMIPDPMVVQRVDEEHHGIVLGESLEAPPRTNADGSVRYYDSRKFFKLC